MNHRQILFLDIETVPEFRTFTEVPEAGRAAFMKRFSNKIEEAFPKGTFDNPDAGDIYLHNQMLEKVYTENASFLPEYSRIVTISMGVLYQKDNSKPTNPDSLRVNTLMGTSDPASERDILTKFCQAISAASKVDETRPRFDFLCAHNGKLFDFPFIVNRLIIHGMPIPRLLNTFFAKPWEVGLIDTGEIWNTTNKKTMKSLDMIAYALGLPSPKIIMKGADVAPAFWNQEYDRIKKYCAGDVVTLARAYMRMVHNTYIDDEFLEII